MASTTPGYDSKLLVMIIAFSENGRTRSCTIFDWLGCITGHPRGLIFCTFKGARMKATRIWHSIFDMEGG